MNKSLWKRKTKYENASPERKNISSLDRDKQKLKKIILTLQEAIKVRNEKIKELNGRRICKNCREAIETILRTNNTIKLRGNH